MEKKYATDVNGEEYQLAPFREPVDKKEFEGYWRDLNKEMVRENQKLSAIYGKRNRPRLPEEVLREGLRMLVNIPKYHKKFDKYYELQGKDPVDADYLIDQLYLVFEEDMPRSRNMYQQDAWDAAEAMFDSIYDGDDEEEEVLEPDHTDLPNRYTELEDEDVLLDSLMVTDTKPESMNKIMSSLGKLTDTSKAVGFFKKFGKK